MSEDVHVKNTGLRGVTVADSAISFIDGEKGILIYRGYRIEDLADNSTYMETVYLLLYGALPTVEQLADFSARVKAVREVPGFVLDAMRLLPQHANPMDVLQACVPLLAMIEERNEAIDRQASLNRAIGLIARMPTLVAAWHRIRNGQPVLPPDGSLDHAANFLWMLQGKKPDPIMLLATSWSSMVTIHGNAWWLAWRLASPLSIFLPAFAKRFWFCLTVRLVEKLLT